MNHFGMRLSAMTISGAIKIWCDKLQLTLNCQMSQSLVISVRWSLLIVVLEVRSDVNLAKLSDANVGNLVAILILRCDSRNGSNCNVNLRTHWALIGSNGLVLTCWFQ